MELVNKSMESYDSVMQEIMNANPGAMGQDPFRYSAGQVKHIRDALIELSTKSEDAKRAKLERLAIAMNSILQTMLVTNQEFIYIKSKLN